jgi:uncharacterized membrane-anchored protein YitT (DUF2179 family)
MENQKNIQIGLKNEKTKKKIKEYANVSLGVIILNIAFYFFLSPSGIVTGGMLGVSILLQPVFDMIGSWFTASIFLYIVNFITLILGLIFLGKDFFLKTVYGTFLSPTILFVLERLFDPNYFLQTVTGGNQKIIALICGAIGAGIGIALAIKSNGSTGGMDVIQRIISKYLKIPMSVAMYFTDWVVVLLAGFLITNGSIREYTFIYQIENVVFGSIGVFAQGYIIDYICISGKSRRTVYIITNMENEIKNLIYDSLNRGVTLVDVTGGYTNEGRKMLVCTMDKKEAYKITDMISELDPNAFTFVTSCKEVKGKYRSKNDNYDI